MGFLYLLFLILMALFITSLNSGSNGNCYYIGNNNEAVIIDAGISCRETERRMSRLGLSMSTVKAIFVSHEHADHITGIPRISKKYQIPVYITDATHRHSHIPIDKHLIFPFKANKSVKVGSISVLPFKKSHDASDPHSFMVSDHQVNIGVFTDIGFSCKRVIRHFKECHAAFLEANYCEDMLTNGHYPYHLKERIRSDQGHLSNAQALELFINHRNEQLSHLILSHLSKNNNSPKLVEKLFRKHAGTTTILVASRYEEMPVYCIAGSRKPVAIKRYKASSQAQLSLFPAVSPPASSNFLFKEN